MIENNLGIDIGTNSIGWCLVAFDEQNESGQILGMGSRPIPIDPEYLGKWSKGAAKSPNASRREKRSARRMNQRYKARRERLVKVCSLIGLYDDYEIGKTKIAYDDFLKKAVAGDLGFDDYNSLPEDLIIYYLRHIALTKVIPPQYLFKILYHLNQRRGFKSSRKEQLTEEGQRKKEKIEIVKTVEILSCETLKGKNDKTVQYSIKVQYDGISIQGTTGDRNIPPYLGREIELKITKETSKSNEVKYTFTIPKETDWTFRRDTLNDEIVKSGKTVGAFYYQKIVEGYKEQKFYKIKDNIVLRDRYTEEFDAIWACQTKLNPALTHVEKLKDIALMLYPQNPQKQNEIMNLSYGDIIKKHIIYYKRDLKKQIVGTCSFEPLKKVAPKSCPLFQEIRLWQLVNNLKINDENKFFVRNLTADEKERAFDILNNRISCEQKTLFNELINKKNPQKHQFNFRDGKVLTGNITRSKIKAKLEHHKFDATIILEAPQYFEHVWHVIHSVDTSKEDVSKALFRYFQKEKIVSFTSAIADDLATLSFETGYASMCTRAIKKLLPLMQAGKYFKKETIWKDAYYRIDNLIHKIHDDSVGDQTRKSLEDKTTFDDFQGSVQPHAVALVYGMNREQKELYTDPNDIKLFPHNSLRNPVVEQVVNETLQVVKEIWQHYNIRPDSIRIELARALKLSADEREKMTTNMLNKEKLNASIRGILRELNIGNPESTADIEKFKLWAELGKTADINPLYNVTKIEVDKYKLWQEADFRSPYTGRVIPISQLFTEAIQVEHIIPRARYFDDSMNNKTVCESHVNKDKDDNTAFEYLKKGSGKEGISLFSFEAFKQHVLKTFPERKAKQFLMEQIPDDFIERQLNDTRIIGVRLAEALRPVTPNVYTTTGGITDLLKKQWGLSELFKEMLKERYQKVAKKANLDIHRTIFYKDIIKYGKPTGEKTLVIKGFSKRFDHRHHALDALVIACTTQSHVQRLNQLNQVYDKMEDRNKRNDAIKTHIESLRKFRPLWRGFRNDAQSALESIIVPTKNKRKLITHKKHKYIKVVDGSKMVVKQTKGDNIVVRGGLHNDTYYGETLIMKKIDHIPDFIKTCFSAKGEISADRVGYLTQFIKKRIAYEHQQTALIQMFIDADFEEKKILESLNKTGLINPLNGKILRGLVTKERKYASRCTLNGDISAERIRNMVDKALQAEILNHIEEIDKEFKSINSELYSGIKKEMILKISIEEETKDADDNPPENDDKKDNNAKTVAKAIENALGTEGLLKFNDKRLKASQQGGKAIYPVYKIRVIEDPKWEVGEISKVNLVRKNADNHKMHVMPGDNYAVGVYAYTKEGVLTREFQVLSFFEAVNKATKGEPLFEKAEGATLFSLIKGDLVYVPYPDENVSAIDWTNRKKLFARIWKVVQTGKTMYFVPHNMSKVITYKNKSGKEINDYESQRATAWFVEEDNSKTIIKDKCILLKVDRLGLNITPILNESV
jgi:CRISPR-associated endonuclease Csn1